MNNQLTHGRIQSAEEANYEARGITSTPTIKLGAPVILDKHGVQWHGFILSIDNKSYPTDFIVNWTSVPAGTEKGSYAVFNTDIITWDDRQSVWRVDPASVPG